MNKTTGDSASSLSPSFSLSLSFNDLKTCLASPSLIENANSSWHKKNCHTCSYGFLVFFFYGKT